MHWKYGRTPKNQLSHLPVPRDKSFWELPQMPQMAQEKIILQKQYPKKTYIVSERRKNFKEEKSKSINGAYQTSQ